jgi:hypothetical protein
MKTLNSIQMKKITPILTLITVALLSSNCMGIKNVTVDTREPGQIAWSSGVSSVVIVNNVIQQPADVGHNTLAVGQTDWERSKASADSVAIIYTEALAQFLDEERHFNRVIYFNDRIRADRDFFVEKPLSPEQMGQIMRQTGANAIISLDRLLMQTDQKGHFVTENFIYGEIIARINSLIRVYTPTSEGRIPVVQYTDSIRWEGFDRTGRLAYGENVLPTSEEAMKELAIHAAERMTNTLSPHWATQQRWYYTSLNSRMREGERFAQGNQWDKALEKWEAAFENVRGAAKAKAASNIALAYEMSDNIEKAYEWATTANLLFEKTTSPNSLERRRSALYKTELERRQNNANRLLDMTE